MIKPNQKRGNMKVREIMRNARTVPVGTNVMAAAKIMNDRRIGSVIVIDGKKIAGIMTERDILEKVTAKNKLASKVRVDDIMTKKVISIEPEAFIDDAVYLLISRKIKKLPVIEDGELVGIITSTDLMTNSTEVGQFYIFD